MPKFYIVDEDNEVVLDASTPLSACVTALQHRIISKVPVNDHGKVIGHYLVSERGFNNPDSLHIPIAEVVNVLFGR